MLIIKQGTAITLRIGRYVDEDDGKTAETSLVINASDVLLSKAGGAFAPKNEATGCTHDTRGWYACPLNTTDTNTVGQLCLEASVSGALSVWHEYMVMEATAFESLFGTDKLQVDVREVAGAAVAGVADFKATGYSTLVSDDVQAAALAAVQEYDPPTDTEMSDAFAALNDLSSANVQAAALAAVQEYDPPTNDELDSALAALALLTSDDVETACTSSLGTWGKTGFALSTEGVTAVQSGLATTVVVTAGFTEIKGDGWSESTDTLEVIGAYVDAIKAKTDTLGSVSVTYTGPAYADGTWIVYAGDDCLASDGREIGATVSNYDGVSLDGATAVMRLISTTDYNASDTAATVEVDATVSQDGTTVTLSADLTAAQTAALGTMPPGKQYNYIVQFIVTVGASLITLVTGKMTVKKRIAAAT